MTSTFNLGPFGKTAWATLLIPAVLGIAIGELYTTGIVGTAGWWLDTVSAVMRLEMDMVGFFLLFFGGLYLAVVGKVGKVEKLYQVSKWISLKSALAVTLVPTLFFFLGFLMPDAAALQRNCAILMLDGFGLAIGLNLMLP